MASLGDSYEKTISLIENPANRIGKKFLNETYTSLVHYHKSIDKIIVSNLGGPLSLSLIHI